MHTAWELKYNCQRGLGTWILGAQKRWPLSFCVLTQRLPHSEPEINRILADFLQHAAAERERQ